ncbi:hypothetical protein N752_19835 [Desulforamulus aquiferis]|nr:hypothetical protein N752_19835 [Desulforamulus aquiferis]
MVQLNGKVRERMNIPANLSPAEMQEYVMAMDAIKQLIEGKKIVKIIPVPGKLINIVVK